MAHSTKSVSLMATRTETIALLSQSPVFTNTAQVRFTSRKMRLTESEARWRGNLERTRVKFKAPFPACWCTFRSTQSKL